METPPPPQRVARPRDFKGLILEAAAPPGSRNRIGNAGHMLGPSGQDDVGHTGLDHGHAGDGGLHARDADPVDGDGGNGFGDSGQQGADPGHIQGVGGFHAAAVADIVDHDRIDARPPNGLFHSDTRQDGAVQVTEGAAECADGGPAAGYDDNVFH